MGSDMKGRYLGSSPPPPSRGLPTRHVHVRTEGSAKLSGPKTKELFDVGSAVFDALHRFVQAGIAKSRAMHFTMEVGQFGVGH